MTTFTISRHVCLVVFSISVFKSVPVVQSTGLQILDLLLQNQTLAQCVSIYIHGFEELDLIEKYYEKYDNFRKSSSEINIISMCIKFVFLNSSFEPDSEIAREVSRYTEISSIVLLPAMTGYHPGKSFNPEYIEKVVYDVFGVSFRLSVHCVILIVDNHRVFKTNESISKVKVQKYPANMVVMKFKIKKQADGCNVVLHYLQHLCDGYCPQYWTEGQTFGELVPSLMLHKKNMYRANFRSISYAYVPTVPKQPKDVVLYCSKFVAKLNSMYCDSKVMVIVLLEKLHNFTFTIYNLQIKSQSKAYVDGTDPYITSVEMSFQNTLDVAFEVTNLHDGSQGLIYCKKESRAENRNAIMHWIEPFAVLLWLYCFMLLGISFLFTVVSTNSVHDSFGIIYGVLGVILRQYTNVVGRKLLILTSFFGLIVGSFYETQTTSLAIVQLPPQKIQSLQELLQKGYKILAEEEADLRIYKHDFKIKGVLDKFDESWFIYASSHDDYNGKMQVLWNLLATQKYATTLRTSYVSDNAVRYEKNIPRETGVAEFHCYGIPNELLKYYFYWTVSVKNRYWVKKSMLYMQEAGLYEIWNRWLMWFYQLDCLVYEREREQKVTLLEDSFIDKKQLGPGLVTAQEVMGFFLLALCPYITGVVVLVVEMCTNRIKIILSGNSVQIIIEVKTDVHISNL
ncbi:unnamed protein product [Orchesella dallaii]|uniref:Uncharacterized protein n=1 Tax=Orchesella dallaii TaxID=48710 RepID=A0ABP1RLI1_9HEXA